MATAAAESMREVVTAVAPILKDAGFRKRRHAFSRSTAPGIVQAVNFQMGAYDPPGPPGEPPGDAGKYGKFTMNFGVHVDVVSRSLYPDDHPSWINEFDCHVRQRPGALMPGERDLWWSLDDVAEATANARTAVRDYGLPWLDTLRTEGDILALDHDQPGTVRLPPAWPLWMAIIRRHRGEHAAADALVRKYLARDLHEHRRRHLQHLLPQLGFGHLLEPQ